MKPLQFLRAARLACGCALLAAAPVACQRPDGRPPTSGAARIGGPFSLVDQDGRPIDNSVLRGRWTVVYFGYTFCPDVCPTTLAALGQAQARLGADAPKMRVLFITVDPERDTPARLRAWLADPSFPRHVIGLTGSPAQIAAVARAYGVYYRRDGATADYGVDHTSVAYLMNPAGVFDRPLPTSDPAAIAGQIEQAIHGAS